MSTPGTSLTPEQLRTVVDEVVRRVEAALKGGAAPGAAPAPAACTLAHGVAAQPPAAAAPAPAPAKPAAPEIRPAAPAGAVGTAALVDAGACRLGHCRDGDHGQAQSISCGDLAPYIDHTLLKPNATDEQVEALCQEARRHAFATVCVNPGHVELCARLLRGTTVKVCTVIGFPLGATTMESKAFETRDCIAKGAEEVDMVLNIGHLKQGDYGYVLRDIEAVVKAAHGIPVKVILETSMLTDEQKIIACALSKAAGAQFVKTSTGFGGGGATPDDIALMRRVVGDEMGVKASGGIRDCAGAQKLIEAGADRLGASASVAIVMGQKGTGAY